MDHNERLANELALARNSTQRQSRQRRHTQSRERGRSDQLASPGSRGLRQDVVAGGVRTTGKSQGPGESAPPGEVTPKTAGGDGASLTSSALGRGSGRGRRQATFTAADPTEVRGSDAKRAVARARRRWRRRETLGQPDGVGRKKRAPNTSSPERPQFYTQDNLQGQFLIQPPLEMHLQGRFLIQPPLEMHLQGRFLIQPPLEIYFSFFKLLILYYKNNCVYIKQL